MRGARRTRSARAAGPTWLPRSCGPVGVAMAEASGEVAAVPASGAANGLSNGAGGPPPQTNNPLSRKLHKILETRLDNDKVTGAAPGRGRRPSDTRPRIRHRRGGGDPAPRGGGGGRGGEAGGLKRFRGGWAWRRTAGRDPVPPEAFGVRAGAGRGERGQDEARRREPVATGSGAGTGPGVLGHVH